MQNSQTKSGEILDQLKQYSFACNGLPKIFSDPVDDRMTKLSVMLSVEDSDAGFEEENSRVLVDAQQALLNAAKAHASSIEHYVRAQTDVNSPAIGSMYFRYRIEISCHLSRLEGYSDSDFPLPDQHILDIIDCSKRIMNYEKKLHDDIAEKAHQAKATMIAFLEGLKSLIDQHRERMISVERAILKDQECFPDVMKAVNDCVDKPIETIVSALNETLRIVNSIYRWAVVYPLGGMRSKCAPGGIVSTVNTFIINKDNLLSSPYPKPDQVNTIFVQIERFKAILTQQEKLIQIQESRSRLHVDLLQSARRQLCTTLNRFINMIRGFDVSEFASLYQLDAFNDAWSVLTGEMVELDIHGYDTIPCEINPIHLNKQLLSFEMKATAERLNGLLKTLTDEFWQRRWQRRDDYNARAYKYLHNAISTLSRHKKYNFPSADMRVKTLFDLVNSHLRVPIFSVEKMPELWMGKYRIFRQKKVVKDLSILEAATKKLDEAIDAHYQAGQDFDIYVKHVKKLLNRGLRILHRSLQAEVSENAPFILALVEKMNQHVSVPFSYSSDLSHKVLNARIQSNGALDIQPLKETLKKTEQSLDDFKSEKLVRAQEERQRAREAAKAEKRKAKELKEQQKIDASKAAQKEHVNAGLALYHDCFKAGCSGRNLDALRAELEKHIGNAIFRDFSDRDSPIELVFNDDMLFNVAPLVKAIDQAANDLAVYQASFLRAEQARQKRLEIARRVAEKNRAQYVIAVNKAVQKAFALLQQCHWKHISVNDVTFIDPLLKALNDYLCVEITYPSDAYPDRFSDAEIKQNTSFSISPMLLQIHVVERDLAKYVNAQEKEKQAVAAQAKLDAAREQKAAQKREKEAAAKEKAAQALCNYKDSLSKEVEDCVNVLNRCYSASIPGEKRFVESLRKGLSALFVEDVFYGDVNLAFLKKQVDAQKAVQQKKISTLATLRKKAEKGLAQHEVAEQKAKAAVEAIAAKQAEALAKAEREFADRQAAALAERKAKEKALAAERDEAGDAYSASTTETLSTPLTFGHQAAEMPLSSLTAKESDKVKPSKHQGGLKDLAESQSPAIQPPPAWMPAKLNTPTPVVPGIAFPPVEFKRMDVEPIRAKWHFPGLDKPSWVFAHYDNLQNNLLQPLFLSLQNRSISRSIEQLFALNTFAREVATLNNFVNEKLSELSAFRDHFKKGDSILAIHTKENDYADACKTLFDSIKSLSQQLKIQLDKQTSIFAKLGIAFRRVKRWVVNCFRSTPREMQFADAKTPLEFAEILLRKQDFAANPDYDTLYKAVNKGHHQSRRRVQETQIDRIRQVPQHGLQEKLHIIDARTLDVRDVVPSASGSAWCALFGGSGRANNIDALSDTYGFTR